MSGTGCPTTTPSGTCSCWRGASRISSRFCSTCCLFRHERARGREREVFAHCPTHLSYEWSAVRSRQVRFAPGGFVGSREEVSYTLGEEIAHAITHGVGAALSIAGLILVVVRAAEHGDPWRITSFAIYGTTLFLLYLSSTLYHAIPNPRAKHVFKILDHVSIYLLIAGTYTPFFLVSLRESIGLWLFAAVWSVAIAGIVLKVFAIHRFERLSLVAYLAMGWLCVLAYKDMVASIPHEGIVALFLGGAFYSGGVIFYVWDRLPYNHAIWHLFVLAGSVTHFLGLLLYVLPASA
ncbi:MAG: hemolysin III family protein [Chrysiogenetes bacterium]|nr:hemolysin III family protein [Chrysiogenetes bacterium]